LFQTPLLFIFLSVFLFFDFVIPYNDSSQLAKKQGGKAVFFEKSPFFLKKNRFFPSKCRFRLVFLFFRHYNYPPKN